MTLEQAINHLEKELNTKQDWSCIACKEEHEQLLEWLKELQAIKNAKPSETSELVSCLKYYLLNMVPYYDWLNDIEKYILKAQEQEKFIDIIKRKGMFISAKELNLMKTYEDYKNVINERKLQQELMQHITPTLIDWETLESTPFYTEKEFDIVKRS